MASVDSAESAATRHLREFVLKVHSRCDLKCDHCYVYEGPDSTWRMQPKAISNQTLHAITRRITEHADRHSLDSIRIVLHGGEPLLLGIHGMQRVIETLRAGLTGVRYVDLTLQTNAVRLDERFADLFLQHDVRVGVSLDGGRRANDRHRRFADGRSSFDAAVQGIRLLSAGRYRPIFAGLLCTIDIRNDPVATFDDLAALDPPGIDLLLPHATWEQPPPAVRPDRTPYGDWLVTVFDHWYAQPPRVGIRIFEALIHALLGGTSRSEAIGLSRPASVVLETDGSIEQTDALKVAFHGAANTGYDVVNHAFDDLLEDPRMAGTAFGAGSLSATCRTCPLLPACGGGLYAHRYRSGTGFANPSVYCRDLARLIIHVRNRVASDLRQLKSMD